MERSFIKELLKDLEMEDSVRKNIINSIMSANGDDVNAEKSKLETVKNDLKIKEGLVEELNTKIKDLDSVDIEEIKKEQFELGKTEGSKEVDNFKKTNALKSEIKGAKDIDLVLSRLDKEKIEYEKNDKDEYVAKGVEEQIKSLQETHAYLFEEEQEEINLGGEHGGQAKTEPSNLLSALKEKYN